MKALSRFLSTVAAATLVVGCASSSDEADEVGDTDSAILGSDSSYSGITLSKERVAELVREAGFPERLVWPVVCTAFYESGFDIGAIHRNSATSIDHGLFQINSLHLRGNGTDGCPTAAADRDLNRYLASRESSPRTSSVFHPETNARCAFGVFRDRRDGLEAWYGYRAHRSECSRATERWSPR